MSARAAGCWAGGNWQTLERRHDAATQSAGCRPATPAKHWVELLDEALAQV